MEDTEFAAAVEAQMQWREEARKLITFRAALHPTHQTARFPGFSQRINHYTAGTQIQKGALPLPVDLVMHESVPTTLSDGTTIYSDIFFPGGFDSLENSECAERVPAIVAWSPYGKQAGTTILDDFPMRAGVPLHWLSGLQKWEGPDPAFWCQHGYAVVNVDTRGAYTSEGDLLIMGYQEAQDGAEFITWLSKQPWCNGKVGLTGNSWLALAQWKIGSLRPEGLAALAPWEGLEDCYRDDLCMGGIPFPAFNKSIADTFASRGKLEDMAAALEKSPLWNSYWEDKKGHSEWINVPTYVVASWTNPIHTPGTLRAYSKIPESVPKWLRVHNSMEWPDYYEDHSQRDLKRFFDYTLKGDHDNGWASTPKVRLSVLHFGLSDLGDTVNRPETDWPLQRTKYRTLYLGSDGRLSQRMEGSEGSVCYDSGNGRAEFRWTLPEEVETTGHFLVRLVMSCPSHNDMDIFVQVHCIKAGADQASGVLTIKPKTHCIIYQSMNIREQFLSSRMNGEYWRFRLDRTACSGREETSCNLW
ncbi:hypothetical protein SLS56_010884 [Neofusicoccum ribis]|uniref:Xaa-Pro dipeptidyl-peptidase C-terminal domain-containing protein n=1 Tax=Neofusicoccum ribis TaxID=45134 RepID=A0ABR3SD61_9PEZI